MDKKRGISYVKSFKSEEEIIAFFRKCYKETWNNCDNNYVVLKSDKIFVNRSEIELSAGDQKHVICKRLKRKDISKIEFLDNTERKGAALIITLHPNEEWKSVAFSKTTKTSNCFDSSFHDTILIIPIMNGDDESIQKISYKLLNFCQFDDSSSSKISFYKINFYQFQKRISALNLKPIIYNSNDKNGLKFIVIQRNNYSIKISNVKLQKFLANKKQPLINVNDSPSINFYFFKSESIFKKCLMGNIFKSKNYETNENYDLNGKAFKSLFYNEWLHCDLIDSYLNEWRERMYKNIINSVNNNGIRVKIFNTLLFERLTRNIKFTPSLLDNKIMLQNLQKNANRISHEKIYHHSTFCYSIFDFDIVIIPICINCHWVTGIIYQPRNILIKIEKKDNGVIEINDNIFSSILIYNSLPSTVQYNNYFCTIVIKEYIKACYNSLSEKSHEKQWYFDENSLKINTFKDPYEQKNKNDCGLFMLEFIRQIMIKPLSLERMIKGESMTKVLSGFNVNLSRNYLKSFVYSKVHLKNWPILYEMEEFFLTQYCGKKIRKRHSYSVKLKTKKGAKKIVVRSRSCNCLSNH
uniref:ULP_PROTEASE domain-containing protein n=1 Tax=Strongyloides stercoralis TaxID=6248 RepID=A0A0K0E8F8_STRER